MPPTENSWWKLNKNLKFQNNHPLAYHNHFLVPQKLSKFSAELFLNHTGIYDGEEDRIALATHPLVGGFFDLSSLKS